MGCGSVGRERQEDLGEKINPDNSRIWSGREWSRVTPRCIACVLSDVEGEWIELFFCIFIVDVYHMQKSLLIYSLE